MMPINQRVRILKFRQIAVIDELRACGVLLVIEQVIQIVIVAFVLDDRIVDLRIRAIEPADIIAIDRTQLFMVDLSKPLLDRTLRQREAACLIRRAEQRKRIEIRRARVLR